MDAKVGVIAGDDRLIEEAARELGDQMGLGLTGFDWREDSVDGRYIYLRITSGDHHVEGMFPLDTYLNFTDPINNTAGKRTLKDMLTVLRRRVASSGNHQPEQETG